MACSITDVGLDRPVVLRGIRYLRLSLGIRLKPLKSEAERGQVALTLRALALSWLQQRTGHSHQLAHIVIVARGIHTLEKL